MKDESISTQEKPNPESTKNGVRTKEEISARRQAIEKQTRKDETTEECAKIYETKKSGTYW